MEEYGLTGRPLSNFFNAETQARKGAERANRKM
jgi:hypothetical protein